VAQPALQRIDRSADLISNFGFVSSCFNLLHQRRDIKISGYYKMRFKAGQK